MSEQFRREFERRQNVVDLATGEPQSDKELVRTIKPIVHNWVPVVHGHSQQGRSDAAKLGWERRKARAAASAMLGVPGDDDPRR